MSIEHLVPDSNRLENFLHIPLGLADSAGLRNLMGVAMANAYQAGFQGCFTTSPDSPPWAVKVAEMGIDAFREAVGRNHYTVEQVMPAALQGEGKGKRAANCAYIMKLMPSGLAGSQDYGNCRSWSMRGGTMALAGMAVAKGQAVRLEHRHGTALVYGSRGHGGQGMDMGTGCKVVTAIGQSEEKDYGDGLDLSTESKDEAAGNRWGRGGPPAELVEAVRGDVVAKAWLLKSPTAEMVMDVFWAEGVIDTGSTMTAAKPKDGFLSGLTRIGGHAQCAMLYDDTDETREWYTKTTGNTINDFFVGVDQSWGEWMSFKYWPEHLWGPRPQGMWVITGSDFVRICKDWGDSWAMTGLQGFTPRTLPDWGSGEYL